MAELQDLPAELLVNILSYLPLQPLLSVQIASRHWYAFFATHHAIIFHQAAYLHNFVASFDIPLHLAKRAHSGRLMQGVVTWKQFCQRRLTLEKNWTGRGSITSRVLGNSFHDVHRTKVDERYGLLITTHESGGLRVTDLESDELLWALNRVHVRHFAHCEYDNGFMVFDRLDNANEVWRLVQDYDDASSDLPALAPSPEQLAASVAAANYHRSSSQRGHFRPWALLPMAEPGCAFRLVYPTLVVVGYERAYLWNIESAQIVQTIHDIQAVVDGATLGHIRYAEVSDQLVFICGSKELRIFNRANGALMLRLPSCYDTYADPPTMIYRIASLASGNITRLEARISSSTERIIDAGHHEFVAVHVSKSGKDLAALLSNNRIILIQDFERIIKGQVALSDAALELLLPPSRRTTPALNAFVFEQYEETDASVYLSFECGRVALVTTSGVYIITLDAIQSGLIHPEQLDDFASNPRNDLGLMHGFSDVNSERSFPYFIPSQITCFIGKQALGRVACLQMTETRLYVTWDSRYMPRKTQRPRRRVLPWRRHIFEDAARPSGSATASATNTNNAPLEPTGTISPSAWGWPLTTADIGFAESSTPVVGSSSDADASSSGQAEDEEMNVDDEYEEEETDSDQEEVGFIHNPRDNRWFNDDGGDVYYDSSLGDGEEFSYMHNEMAYGSGEMNEEEMEIFDFDPSDEALGPIVVVVDFNPS